MEILAAVTELFRSVFMDDSLEVNGETSPNEVEGWDSFTHLNLILALESRFGIAITDQETPALKTVGAITALVAAKAGAAEEVS